MIEILKKLYKPPKKNVLNFSYGGRYLTYKGAATNLYRHNPEFSECIKECNEVIRKYDGKDILWFFEEGPHKDLLEEIHYTCITAIQIAITKLLFAQGIFPTSVIGVSLGEIAALYAAGAMDMESALIISVSYFLEANNEYLYHDFSIKLSYDDAISFCASLSFWSDVFFEYDATTVLIKVMAEDDKHFIKACSLQNIPFEFISETKNCYHNSKNDPKKIFLKNRIGNIVIKPLQCDIYSSVNGEIIPRGTILSIDYFIDVNCNPCKMYSAFNAAFKSEVKEIVIIGSKFINDEYYQSISEFPIQIIHTLCETGDETKHLKQTIRLLGKDSLTSTKDTLQIKEQETYKHFINNFNIYNTETLAGIKYLRTVAPIHFMPVNNAWIILNYNDLQGILKDENTFSNKLYESIDPVLLSTSGDTHSKVKEALNPLFSNAILADLSNRCFNEATSILDRLIEKVNFDIVTDFARPLMNSILFYYFGFTNEDIYTFEKDILSQRNADWFNHFLQLESFFSNCLSNSEYHERKGAINEILKLKENGIFTQEDCIAVLRIFWVASSETTLAFLTIIFFSVLEQFEIAKSIKGNEQLMSKFVEECLRLESSSRVQRVTTIPVEIAGQYLPVGSKLILNLQSANTDSKYFDSPYTFSILRSAKRNLAFGTGIHQCIGMGMARTLGRAATKALMDKYEGIITYKASKPSFSFANFNDNIDSIKVQKKMFF